MSAVHAGRYPLLVSGHPKDGHHSALRRQLSPGRSGSSGALWGSTMRRQSVRSPQPPDPGTPLEDATARQPGARKLCRVEPRAFPRGPGVRCVANASLRMKPSPGWRQADARTVPSRVASQAKLQRREYPSLEACAKDVRLVWSNAHLYNPVSTAEQRRPRRACRRSQPKNRSRGPTAGRSPVPTAPGVEGRAPRRASPAA